METSGFRFSFLPVGKALLLVGFCATLTGCGSLSPEEFADSNTHFEPDVFFSGRIQSWGVIENRNGEPMRRFSTDCLGIRLGDGALEVKQVFHYDNGRVDQRVWHVHKIDDHDFEATASDVVGAARGKAFGNAFRWKYTLAVKPGNPLTHVRLTQWMYMPENTETMFTRVVVRKWGIRLAEIAESFHKVPPDEPASNATK